MGLLGYRDAGTSLARVQGVEAPLLSKAKFALKESYDAF